MEKEAVPPTIRVLLVEDHEVVRDGLEMLLAQCEGIEVVGTAGTGEEGIELSASLLPDLVLLDLSLPGMHGLEALPSFLGQSQHPPRVVVLTVHDDDDMVLRAVRGGAQGYVLKSASRDELVTAVRRVAAGGQSFDDVVVRAFIHGEQRADEQLSRRELQVLQLVAAGQTNKEIGGSLYLSPGTVKAHLDSIYRKLGASDRAQAVATALRRGLLE